MFDNERRCAGFRPVFNRHGGPAIAIIALLMATVSAAAPESPFSAEERSHWAFQPVRRHDPPAVKQSGWVKTPIDNFLLARLEAKGLAPAPEASRRALIRRAMYDLHGLPPSPAEVDAFVADQRTDAYERLIDRLLRSPRYGERWARHWLDLAHYAESVEVSRLRDPLAERRQAIRSVRVRATRRRRDRPQRRRRPDRHRLPAAMAL